MSVGRITKIIAGILFIFAAFGFNPNTSLALIPLGLAIWVLGEAV